MAYAVTVDAEHELVEVDYSGYVSIENRHACAAEVIAAIEATGFQRILVDYTNAKCTVESFEAIRQHAAQVAASPVLGKCRSAYVGHAAQAFNEAFESLADAKRYPFCRFHGRDEAIVWLQSDAPALGRLSPIDGIS